MKAIYCSLLLVILFTFKQTEGKRKTKKYYGAEHEIVPEDKADQEQPVENLKYEIPPEGSKESNRESDILEAVDPCEGKCRTGEVCQFNNDVAMCICIPSCPEENDPRRKVCSNLNSTWGSDCELHQMRCWCRSGNEKCVGDKEKQSHMHIDYYGACRQPEECTEGQMADFPRRMRDWLFNVMRDSADRDELSAYYLKMEREAETEIAKRWTLSAIWKFCELDKSHDRTISRHEIFPIRAPLVALEHCIAPFLDKCDADGNHRITLEEWAACLEIKKEDIEDKCEEVRESEGE